MIKYALNNVYTKFHDFWIFVEFSRGFWSWLKWNFSNYQSSDRSMNRLECPNRSVDRFRRQDSREQKLAGSISRSIQVVWIDQWIDSARFNRLEPNSNRSKLLILAGKAWFQHLWTSLSLGNHSKPLKYICIHKKGVFVLKTRMEWLRKTSLKFRLRFVSNFEYLNLKTSKFGFPKGLGIPSHCWCNDRSYHHVFRGRDSLKTWKLFFMNLGRWLTFR